MIEKYVHKFLKLFGRLTGTSVEKTTIKSINEKIDKGYELLNSIKFDSNLLQKKLELLETNSRVTVNKKDPKLENENLQLKLRLMDMESILRDLVDQNKLTRTQEYRVFDSESIINDAINAEKHNETNKPKPRHAKEMSV